MVRVQLVMIVIKYQWVLSVTHAISDAMDCKLYITTLTVRAHNGCSLTFMRLRQTADQVVRRLPPPRPLPSHCQGCTTAVAGVLTLARRLLTLVASVLRGESAPRAVG